MKLRYITIYVPDVEQTVQFYEKCLGVRRRFVQDGQYAEVETGVTTLAFASDELARRNHDADYARNDLADSPAGSEICFVVDDVAGAYDAAVGSGATSLAGPARQEWGQWLAYLRDCNGVIIRLASPLPGLTPA